MRLQFAVHETALADTWLERGFALYVPDAGCGFNPGTGTVPTETSKLFVAPKSVNGLTLERSGGRRALAGGFIRLDNDGVFGMMDFSRRNVPQASSESGMMMVLFGVLSLTLGLLGLLLVSEGLTKGLTPARRFGPP
jgi:hypothetical protein